MAEDSPNPAYWNELFSSRPWGRYPPEDLVRFMARSFGGRQRLRPVRVLELGCGPGPNIWFLAREGYEACGIDGSAVAIAQANRRLEEEGLVPGRADLRVGDFSRLPWADGTMDAVVDVASLYANDLATIRAALAEAWRVLKPGGRFFGKMFGTGCTGADTGEAVEPGTRRRPTAGPCQGNELAHFFAREELPVLFSAFEGLRVEECRRSDGGTLIAEWLVAAQKPAEGGRHE